MNSDRHERMADYLKEKAAAFIREEANTDPLITVTRVTTSHDYHNATVFVTTIPDSKEQDALIFLKRKGCDLRHSIMKESSFKVVPHMTFEIDYGERHRQHIDEVVKKIEEEKG